MTVVIDRETLGSSLGVGAPAPVMDIATPRSIPVHVRLRSARRRRTTAALRNWLAFTGITGLALVLVTATFFSLIGR